MSTASLTTLLPSQYQKAVEKDVGDHIADYANPGQGAQDFFRVLNLVLNYVKKIPQLGAGPLSIVNKSWKAFTAIELGIKLPYSIAVGNEFRQNVRQLFSAKSDPQQSTEVAKEAALSGTSFVNTLAEAALFFDHAKILTYSAKLLQSLNVVASATCVITDTADLAKQVSKLSRIDLAICDAQNAKEVVHLQSEKKLAWMTIAQDVSSIALSSLLLLGIAMGAALEATAVFTAVVIMLGTSWLALKIAIHFYDTIVVSGSKQV